MVKILHLQNQNAKRGIEHHQCYKPIKNISIICTQTMSTMIENRYNIFQENWNPSKRLLEQISSKVLYTCSSLSIITNSTNPLKIYRHLYRNALCIETQLSTFICINWFICNVNHKLNNELSTFQPCMHIFTILNNIQQLH